MRRLLCAVVLVAAVGLAGVAQAADAERFPLVVDSSMAGVELQMTKEEVRAALGSPTESRRADDDFGPVRRWYFKGPKVHIYFRPGVGDEPFVTAMLTRRGFVRGPSNSGVGTPERALRERIDELTCKSFRAPGFRQRSCYTGGFSPGEIVTDFRMSRGRVDSVRIAFVID